MFSIVIPVYNEGENICTTIDGIFSIVKGDYRILLIYDKPNDTTLPYAKECHSRYGERVQLIQNHYGTGALNAIKTGLEVSEGTYAIVTMADLSDPPEVMNTMIDSAEREQADIVCASRYMKGGQQIGGPRFKGFLSHTAGLLLCRFAKLPTHDPTNSFKLYRKSFLNQVKIESTGGFELGIELVVKAYAGGYRISEVPTTWRDRVAGKSNFKLWKWLPNYLHWFFYAFRHRFQKRIPNS